MMNADEAVALLRSDSTEDRLNAARTLARVARKKDAAAIGEALRSESDRWVRRSLARALAYTEDRRRRPRSPAGLVSEKDRADELLSVAMANVSRLLLHEFNPVLGDIRRYATAAVADFETSKTREAVDRLDRLMKAIASLNEAASPADMQEFDLAVVMERLCQVCEERSGVLMERSGPQPLLVSGDPCLLELALDQGLRNAVEAMKEADAQGSVEVTWEHTGGNATVQVLDRGIGLPKGFDKTLSSIATTKDKLLHDGMGLLTSRRALLSMGGRLEVLPRPGGGAIFMANWPTRAGGDRADTPG